MAPMLTAERERKLNAQGTPAPASAMCKEREGRGYNPRLSPTDRNSDLPAFGPERDLLVSGAAFLLDGAVVLVLVVAFSSLWAP